MSGDPLDALVDSTNPSDMPTDDPRAGDAVLRVRNLTKTFGAFAALSNVDFDIMPGEVHGLVGENGSGKSTLIKVLSGFYHGDPGSEIEIDGQQMGAHVSTTLKQQRLRFVHQDLGLIMELNAVDNLAMHGGYLRGPIRNVSWRKQKAYTRDLVRSLGAHIDVQRPLSEATPAQRVIVTIAAALQGWDDNRGVLVLDEPTAVLPPHEVSMLLDLVRRLRDRGTSVLYVSHRLDELFLIADRVTVIRGGRHIDTAPIAQLTKSKLVSLMLGRELSPDYRAADDGQKSGGTVVEAKQLTGRFLRDADIALRAGEIVGLAGLPGSGREELPYAIAGALGRSASGQLRSAGSGGRWVGVEKARRLGLVLLPADRKHEGLIAGMNVSENMSISILDKLGRRGRLSRRREQSVTSELVTRLDVRTRGIYDPITSLSGGNQQKVLIGRCLAQHPKVLIVCEPTAGVDLGARAAIYDLLVEQARAGLTVLVSSTDVGDLRAVCDRVLVMQAGRTVRELAGEDLTSHAITKAMEQDEQTSASSGQHRAGMA